MFPSLFVRQMILNHAQIGLDVKTKETEELTETVEITEDIDPDQEIEEEVRAHLTPYSS